MGSTKKISKKKLSESITKAVHSFLLAEELTETGVGKFAEKVDDLIGETIEGLEELILEGEELIKDNPTHSYAIQERNHAVMSRIGVMKALKVRLSQLVEDLHRNV